MNKSACDCIEGIGATANLLRFFSLLRLRRQHDKNDFPSQRILDSILNVSEFREVNDLEEMLAANAEMKLRDYFPTTLQNRLDRGCAEHGNSWWKITYQKRKVKQKELFEL